MSVKLLTEHHLEYLSLTGGCTGWSESTLVKMPHYWKSHVTTQMFMIIKIIIAFNREWRNAELLSQADFVWLFYYFFQQRME